MSADLYLVCQDGVWVELAKQFVSGKVKGRDDLLWVADQLGVKVRVHPEQMVAVDIEKWLL